MAVFISGAVLSSLMYDHATNEGDQYGFLIGEVSSQLTDTISDSQINNVEVETRLNVYDTVPCPKDQKFYNSRGEILQQRIADLLGDKNKTVVGWYSFRRNSMLHPSFRERLLHENLARCLATDRGGGASPEGSAGGMFTFLLCSAKSCTNRSTHTLDHRFLHLINNVFRRVPVNIVNLGDTTHTEYRAVSSHTVSSSQGVYSLILQQHQQEFLNEHSHVDVRRIQALNGALNQKLEAILPAVLESETRLSELEAEVSKCRRLVKLKHGVIEQPASGANHPTSVPVTKAPSVDDILFMDVDEDSTPSYGDQLPTPQFVQTNFDCLDSKSEETPKANQECLDRVDNSGLSLKHDGVTSHSDGKKSSESTFNKSEHNVSGTKKKSSDPFEFVSGILAGSKQEDKQTSGSEPSFMSVKTGAERIMPSSLTKTSAMTNKVTDDKSNQPTETKDKSNLLTNMDKTEYHYRTKVKSSVNPAKDEMSERSIGVQKHGVGTEPNVKAAQGMIASATKNCSQEVDGTMKQEEDGIKNCGSPELFAMDTSTSQVF